MPPGAELRTAAPAPVGRALAGRRDRAPVAASARPVGERRGCDRGGRAGDGGGADDAAKQPRHDGSLQSVGGLDVVEVGQEGLNRDAAARHQLPTGATERRGDRCRPAVPPDDHRCRRPGLARRPPPLLQLHCAHGASLVPCHQRRPRHHRCGRVRAHQPIWMIGEDDPGISTHQLGGGPSQWMKAPVPPHSDSSTSGDDHRQGRSDPTNGVSSCDTATAPGMER